MYATSPLIKTIEKMPLVVLHSYFPQKNFNGLLIVIRNIKRKIF
jgi:hypothetical protein